MKLLTKVCGLKYAENVNTLADSQVQPDLYGFIFYAPSPRYVSKTALPALLDSVQQTKGKRVGVFVDAELVEILTIHAQFPLDYIQLHGNESAELCRQLKNRSFKIIKAFRIGNQKDLDQITPYETVCDYFLFDTAGKLPGGNGITFDWEILQSYRGKTPFILSGGISREHTKLIKQFSHPRFRGIDLNSGFELAPGKKDTALLNHFLKTFA